MTVIEHNLDLHSGNVRVLVQPPLPGGESAAACALVYGEVHDGCLVRIHSRCLYGDVFGSLECDCGPQLERSVQLIERRGSGVVIYLDQEGRGAGLLAKAEAYRYSEHSGADTYSAYEALHLPLDDRSYDAAALLLKELRLRSVRLLTNNPDKIRGLRRQGLSVHREPLSVAVFPPARGYLETKRRHGHLLTNVITLPPTRYEKVRGRHRAGTNQSWMQKMLRKARPGRSEPRTTERARPAPPPVTVVLPGRTEVTAAPAPEPARRTAPPFVEAPTLRFEFPADMHLSNRRIGNCLSPTP